MNRLATAAAAALLIVAGAYAQAPVRWLTDIDAALAAASEDYRLVVIVVNDAEGEASDSVGLRKALADPALNRMLADYVCVRLDANAGGRAAEFLAAYEVFYEPSLLVANFRGDMVTMFPIGDWVGDAGGFPDGLAALIMGQLDFYSYMNRAVFEDYIPTGMVWYLDVDEALAAAKSSGRKLFVYVIMNMCHAVVDMNRDTFSVAAVSDYMNEAFVCLKVDLMDVEAGTPEGDLLGKYGLDSAPTLMFLDANGKRLGQFVGAKSVDEFMAIARRMQAK